MPLAGFEPAIQASERQLGSAVVEIILNSNSQVQINFPEKSLIFEFGRQLHGSNLGETNIKT